MAAAEMRAGWQRTANRCFVQEDAKRAPKLACCQSSSSTKPIDASPTSAADEADHPSIGYNALLKSEATDQTTSTKAPSNSHPYRSQDSNIRANRRAALYSLSRCSRLPVIPLISLSDSVVNLLTQAASSSSSSNAETSSPVKEEREGARSQFRPTCVVIWGRERRSSIESEKDIFETLLSR
ncbi:hypothetical protein Dimus_004465 [Dionaea muscipula]